MGTLPFEPTSAPTSLECSGLPRRVLRHLIIKHDLPVGARVLDVGCGRGQLVQFLYHLGLDVTGMDADRTSIAMARRNAPHLDFRPENVGNLAAAGQSAFDLIVVRNCPGYEDDLFSRKPLETTANLLSCLKPSGLLAFLARTGDEGGEMSVRHAVDCYASHLAAFPGQAETTILPDSYVQPNTWTSLIAGRRPAGYLTATLQIPAAPQTRDDWLHFAESAARIQRPACCAALQSSRPAA